MTDSATQLPHGGKQPFSGKLVIAVVSLAILTFLGVKYIPKTGPVAHEINDHSKYQR